MTLAKSGLGGIAANHDVVIFGDRDFDDFHDVYRCVDAETGQQRWEVRQLAINSLDYGNSPRATPLLHGDSVILFGASGDLLCVGLQGGDIRWQLNVRAQFKATHELPWGYCASPLVAENKLIVNPGANDAALVALAPETGQVIWKTAGRGSSYGSLIAGRFGGRMQIVGHDAETLGGWDVETGERLWTRLPEYGDDFNVPTPVNVGGKLLVTTENNGTRLFDFQSDGKTDPEPVAVNRKLKPNMSSPVLVGNLLYCVDRYLYCLDTNDRLAEIWRMRDPAFADYCAIVASREKLLVIGTGELILMCADGSKEILGRQRVFDEDVEIYSHPALVGNRLYIRGESSLKCVDLSGR